MSSILFSPITFSPLKSTAEYLDETFFICEPSVFHTTPPQPASSARFTLYFLSVGGALANQYGFGDFIPKNVEVISAIERVYSLSFLVYRYGPHPPSPSPAGEGAVLQIFNQLRNYHINFISPLINIQSLRLKWE